jgi:hypothetical protein
VTDADFFASGHPVMKRFIQWGPGTFGVRLGLAAIVLLLLPARIIGLHSFPVAGDDRGFWFEANWSLMFVIVFPGLFGGLVHMVSLMRDSVSRLTSKQLGVITKAGEPAEDFEEYIANYISRKAGRFTALCLSLAVILTGVHGAALARYLAGDRDDPPLRDWTTMYVTGAVRYSSNVAFDVVAYSVEAFAIFVGFFFVLKFWLFLNVFSSSFRKENTDYRFNPIVTDPDRRLGLRPLGDFMNVYLTLVLIFEFYVLGRRLQLIGKAGDYSLSTYITALSSGVHNLNNILDPRMYQWATIDAGLWALLIFLTLPLIVGAYFPLWTLRRYVKRRRDELWIESARAHEIACEAGDEAEATKLKAHMDSLRETQLWPNGDARGWWLLTASLTVALAAWAPPLCASLLALAVGLGLVKWTTARFLRDQL